MEDKQSKPNYKKWATATLCLAVAALLLAGALVVVVDPFFQYHKPLQALAYPVDNDRYQTPGMARNFAYNSVLLGSSTSKNFRTGWFQDEMGLNLANLTQYNATPYNIGKVGQMALGSENQIETVFLGLDFWMLENAPSKYFHEFPGYLYNQNPLDDVNYIFNKNVIFENIRNVAAGTLANGGGVASYDAANNWANEAFFGEEMTVRKTLEEEANEADIGYSADEARENTVANLEENILPLITQNPGVEFVVFLPPVNMMHWHYTTATRDVETALWQIDYAVQRLLEEKNVQVFFFLGEESLVTDLYRYQDRVHFTEDMNLYMTQCFFSGKNRVTEQSWPGELEKLRALVDGFDYSGMYLDNSQTPFKAETSLPDYFSMLKDERYTVFVAAKRENTTLSLFAQELLAQVGLGAAANEPLTGYVGIVQGGTVLRDEASPDAGPWEGQAEGLSYEITAGEEPAIVLDGVQYAVGRGDVNVVVYDNRQARVVDSVAFWMDYDLHLRREVAEF